LGDLFLEKQKRGEKKTPGKLDWDLLFDFFFLKKERKFQNKKRIKPVFLGRSIDLSQKNKVGDNFL